MERDRTNRRERRSKRSVAGEGRNLSETGAHEGDSALWNHGKELIGPRERLKLERNRLRGPDAKLMTMGQSSRSLIRGVRTNRQMWFLSSCKGTPTIGRGKNVLRGHRGTSVFQLL